MSLESKISKNVFQGNGTTKTFSFTFRVWKEDQVLVYVGIGDETEIDVTSTCTITLSENGGTVTFKAAPADGTTIAVVRNMPFMQEDKYITGARFDAHEIEDRLDQDCAERQQLLEGVGRAVKVPTTSSKTPEQYMGAFWEAVKNVLAAVWEMGKNIGNSTYVTATGSDTPRTLADRFGDVVNVKDFGAVGDGVTDDTEAIQKALNAGIGKTVFFPIGEYIVSPDVTFNVYQNTKFIGLSCENTKITTVKTSDFLPYMFLIKGDNVFFYGLHFDGGRIESEKDTLHGRQGLIEYGNVYGYSGLTVDNCHIHDFCSRTIYSLANNTIVTRNKIERCSLFNADLSSMRGVVTNWYDSSSDAKMMNNVIVENNHFIECGHFASLWLKCSSIRERGNLVEYASAIGLGHQWCEDVVITDNTFRYTYMNGVDLQECVRQVISGNTFFMSGYMRTDSSGSTNLCQSLFVGSDYLRQDSRDAVISNNVIEGSWSEDIFDGEEPEDFYMVGTGIVVNNTTNFTISNNVIRGMGRPYSQDRISSEDGMGMHITNKCENCVISCNVIESCKGCGILLGPANVQNATIEENSIKIVGEDGIHVSATSLCSGISISNNTITEIKNLYNKGICSGVFLGTGAANISQVRVNNNSIFNKSNEESGLLEKLFTHGIYFGFDNVISDPSYCGLSTFEIKGNFLNGYKNESIGFDSRCYTSGTARHFRTISDNRCGGHSGTSGLIADVQNRNWAMEFVAEKQPTAGNYIIGDRVWKAFPYQNPIGWVCIATGSPGTWREIQYTISS